MSDLFGWRFIRTAADTTAERLELKRSIENQNGPDTSELVWAADEDSPDFGLRIVRPRTREDYYYEGMLQNNCISGLQIDAYNNYPVVYSVRDENNLPLVSYEARYVPLTQWQSDPYSREEFFGHRESDNPDDHHLWKGPQDGLGVLMTRQVCSVGNHVPGQAKLLSFLRANIEHMKQRGLSYMQYITAEGEHQPGTCQEGCRTQERESLQTNPLLSLDDLEGIVASENLKPANGAKLYLQAPVYSIDKDGEIDANKHRGDLSILPYGDLFKKKAQAEEGDLANIEGREVRIPRGYMVVPTQFNERNITRSDSVHEMLLGRGGGGGLSIAPNARFPVRDRDIVHRRVPVALAVEHGYLSHGPNSVSTHSGENCLTCMPKDNQFLQIESGKFVYDDELEENRDKVLIPLTEEDMHKFRKDGLGNLAFNQLEHSYVPVSKLLTGSELPEHFTHVEEGVAKSHAKVGDNPTGFAIYPHDIKSSVSDEEKKRIADSTYGIFANPSEFAPQLGEFGQGSVLIVDGPDTINHHGKKRASLRGVPWLVKAGSDAFHHLRSEEHIPNGDKHRDGTQLPEEHRCGVTGEYGVEGSCGQPHTMFTLSKRGGDCSKHVGSSCDMNKGLSLKDLIYVGVDHDYAPGRNGDCKACGKPASVVDENGKTTPVHETPIRMQEPHIIWDSEQKKWKPNVDENGVNIGGTERILQFGQDMGAPDFHLVPDADVHLDAVSALTSDEHGVHIPSNISYDHDNPSVAGHLTGTSFKGIPLSNFLDSSKTVTPGPLYDTSHPLTLEKNPELFARSTSENDDTIYINPEKVEAENLNGSVTRRLKETTRSPLTAPTIYYRGNMAGYANAPTSAFSSDGSVSSSLLELSTTPLASEVTNPSEVGELSSYKLNTPEYVCRACGKKAELSNAEEGKEDKKTYQVLCEDHSKAFLQCPGGKSHRIPIQIGRNDKGETSTLIAPSADNDKIEFLGFLPDGVPRIHCRVCKDRCNQCADKVQTTLFSERGVENPRDPRVCPACEGIGSIDSQEQRGTIVREPVAGQRRGTVGLISPDNILINPNFLTSTKVGFIGNTYSEFDRDGNEEVRYLKVPNSAMLAEGTGPGLSEGKAIRLKNAQHRQFKTTTYVKVSKESEKRLNEVQKLRTQQHPPCGQSGIHCDGSPHDNPKERKLWDSSDGKYSIKHLLNSDAFFTEGTMQKNCLAYNYQYQEGDNWKSTDPNPVSLRDENDVPVVTGDLRVISYEDYQNGHDSPYNEIRGVPWHGYGDEDWREEDPERPVRLPDGSAHLINPLFSNDTWSKEIIDPTTGERKPHPEKGILMSRQIVAVDSRGKGDQIPEDHQWIPFLKGIHSIMKDRGIDFFHYVPYGHYDAHLISRDHIGDIITRFDVGDKLKDTKVYMQLPAGNWDPRNPNVAIPDQNSKILPIGEAFNDAVAQCQDCRKTHLQSVA